MTQLTVQAVVIVIRIDDDSSYKEAREREAPAFCSWFSEVIKQNFSLSQTRPLRCRLCRCRLISLYTRTNSNCDFTIKKTSKPITALECISSRAITKTVIIIDDDSSIAHTTQP